MNRRHNEEGISISKIIIGCDHAAYPQKQELINMIKKDYDIEVIDVGCNSDKSCHYPDYAHKACELVLKENNARLILLCASGTGMNIVANKHNGIRCVHGHKIFQVALARQHNNVNGLAMGIKLSEMSDMKGMVQTFLDTEFEEMDSQGNPTRHALRVSKIENKIEKLDVLLTPLEKSHMSNSSKLDDVTNTHISKSKPKKTRSLGNFRKRDNVFPVKVKLNKQPFKQRELPPPPAEDTTLFTKTDFYLKNKDDIEYSDTNSMKVQISHSEVDSIVNETLVGAKLMNELNTPDKIDGEENEDNLLNNSGESIELNISKFDILNDIKVEKQVKSENNTTNKHYVPSVGEPIRDLTKENQLSTNHKTSKTSKTSKTTKNPVMGEIIEDIIEELTEEEVTKEMMTEETININKEVVVVDIAALDKKDDEKHTKSENKEIFITDDITDDIIDGDTLLDQYEDDMMPELSKDRQSERKEDIEKVKAETLRLLKALKDAETRSALPKPTLVRIRTDSIALPPKVPLVKESSTRQVPFNKNDVSATNNIVSFTSNVNVPMNKSHVMIPLNNSNSKTVNTTSSQKDSTTVNDKKIEIEHLSSKRTTIKKGLMPEKLTYPASIDTNNTKLADMINYMNNCNETNKLEQDIMHKIVELRERMKLIKRDLKAEMDCAFDLDDEETSS
jgi:ribose 5-phosphate isomerase B